MSKIGTYIHNDTVIFRFVLSDQLNTYENRSEAVAKVLNDMRARDCLKTLRGWRDEVKIFIRLFRYEKNNIIIVFFFII